VPFRSSLACSSPNFFNMVPFLSLLIGFSLQFFLILIDQAARRRRGGESSPEENLDDVFKVFDQDGDGKIAATEIGTLIRASGKNPTQKEINAIIEEVGGINYGDLFLDQI
jgi:Ca2+-binding EF-hand superfamily protein